MSKSAIQVLAGRLPGDRVVAKWGLRYCASKGPSAEYLGIRLDCREPGNGPETGRCLRYIDEALLEKWQNRWDGDENGRITYQYIPCVSFATEEIRAWFRPGYATTVLLRGQHVLQECPLYNEYRRDLAMTCGPQDLVGLVETQASFSALQNFANRAIAARRNNPLP